MVDDFLLFLQKGLCTCRARIHDRGDSRLQRHIGRNSQGQRMRSRFRSEPVEWGSSMANVVVNVNQSRSNVKLRDIHNLSGLISRNVFFDRSDFSVEHSDVADLVDVISRIDYVSAF